MEFDKNKNESKNNEILKKEIKKKNSPYSQILVDSLFNTSDSDDFRVAIKNKVSQYIDNKIKR
jgi:hypothetical protein